ncbi:hypothetical protein WISP_109201 [Willisornis vidua]|uniref:Uncharacterized protein n=1 Tax=Willisornis vidua TaxID=1566151 RepID=A0ABQ9CW74_9PASS|nr:hypothetical protein WISP_109201 [Willisornis vidua]
MDLLKTGEMSATKMVRGMEDHSYEEKLRELILFNLQKKRFWAENMKSFQYMKMGYKEDGERLLTEACSDRTKANGLKLKEGIAYASA